MAESVGPLKKSTKSESAITDPSRISAILFLVIFSTTWHRYIRKRKWAFRGTLRSTIRTSKQPKSKIRAHNLDKTAIRCDHRIRRSVKSSLWIHNPGYNIYQIRRSVDLFTPLFKLYKLKTKTIYNCFTRLPCENPYADSFFTFRLNWSTDPTLFKLLG